MNQLDQLLKKYLKSCDSGKIFTGLIKPIYLVIGWLHLLLPLSIIIIGYDAFASDYNKLKMTFYNHAFIIVFALLILFLAACIAAYLAIKLWTDRADRTDVLIRSESEFCVLPIIVTFVRNIGEGSALVGLIMGVGFSVAIGLGLAFLSFAESDYFAEIFKHAMIVFFGGIIISIVVSYLTLLFHRFLSELMGLMVSMATNVSRIANRY